MHIFADGLTTLSFSNNNLRINLYQNGPNETQNEVGSLIIPINQAASFINSMASGLTDLNEQLKAQSQETQGTPQ
ncbi:hypothetical protein [Desulfonatronovibrio magnus]|uniref:hypothetical protein n=1 Tax=Desulfonatronovibrio magnus TaxID=698827 RepID=UPI0005EB819B|nr:hypothetical protein [Desulfonatronovibrio magnus]